MHTLIIITSHSYEIIHGTQITIYAKYNTTLAFEAKHMFNANGKLIQSASSVMGVDLSEPRS